MQDSIEQAYFAFRKRLRNIKQANSCECQACSRMQSLDVKFVVHHGEFIRQRMSGREELAGRDVILVHRLLKNDVGKESGAHAYALYSDACALALGIDPGAQSLVEHSEAIEHIGETKCWVRDLDEAWNRESGTARNVVQRADAFAVIERDFAAPGRRSGSLSRCPRITSAGGEARRRRKGRQGPARRRHANHCLHGKDAIIEDILDWRPFDYVTQTALLPIPGAAKILMTDAFDGRDDGGTHFEFRVAKPKPKDLPFLEQVWPAVVQNYDVGFEILRSMLEERAAALTVVDEPSLPISRERFLTHPVHAH